MPKHEKDPQDEIMELFMQLQEAISARRSEAAIFLTLLTPEGNGSVMLCGNDDTIPKMLTRAMTSSPQGVKSLRLMHHMLGLALELVDSDTPPHFSSPVIN